MTDQAIATISEKPIPGRPLILAACMAASFMAAVEATIMTTVMPVIATALDGFEGFAWVFSAYMLAQAVTIPLYGRLTDIYGRRRVFYFGSGLFLVGSILCGFAHSMPQLVVFRVIQGLGAGGVQPVANTIVGDIYTPVERSRVQGLLSGVFGVSAVIGPSLGVFVARHGAWPMVFWINVPIGLAAMAMIAAFLPERTEARPHQVDYGGALLLVLAVGSLMLLLNGGEGLVPIPPIIVATVFLLSSPLLVLYERRRAEPMLPLELWRGGVVASSAAGSLTTGILMMGVTAWLPAYVQGVMGRGADVSAVLLALMAVVWVLGSTVAGLYLPRTTYRRGVTFGACALVAGTGLLIAMRPDNGPLWMGTGMALIGIGMGFCNTTFMISAQTAVPWRQRGAATSSTMFLRFLGQSLGATLFGAIMTTGLGTGADGTHRLLDRLMTPGHREALSPGDLTAGIGALADAMRYAYVLTGLMAFLVLLLARTWPVDLGPGRRTRQGDTIPGNAAPAASVAR